MNRVGFSREGLFGELAGMSADIAEMQELLRARAAMGDAQPAQPDPRQMELGFAFGDESAKPSLDPWPAGLTDEEVGLIIERENAAFERLVDALNKFGGRRDA